MNFILFGFMILSLGGLISTVFMDLIVAQRVLKITTSILFILIGLASYKKGKGDKTFFVFILLGLIFSMFGDTFLVFNTNDGIIFKLGVASFAIGHIMYSIGFSKCNKGKIKDYIIFALIAAGLIILMVFDDFDFKGMFGIVVVYALIISFMVSKAISLIRIYSENKKSVIMLIIGAVAFLISDIILLYFIFYTTTYPILRVINWIIYYIGQGIMALSFTWGITKK